MQTVNHLLQEAARRRPSSRMIWDDGQPGTYADLLLASRRCATALAQLGVRRRDRVALWLPNSEAYLAFLLGTMQLGAIAVAVNTRYRAAEVGAVIHHTEPNVLVISPEFHGIRFAEILSAVAPAHLASIRTVIVCDSDGAGVSMMPGVRVASYRWALEQEPSSEEPDADDDCVIFTTSGTTSGPKYVVHKHRAIVNHARDVGSAFGYDDRNAMLLHALPFCGIFGFSQFMGSMAAGAESVFVTVFNAAVCASLMQEYGVTYTSGTDDLLKRMLDAASGDLPFPNLKECVYAGFNPALSDFPEAAQQRGMRLIGCFGMSEIHSFFSRQNSDLSVHNRKRPGGFPVSLHTVVRVRDSLSGRVLEHGAIGELEIYSDNLFVRYYEQPEATSAAFTDDGYFRTGDFGCVFEDGHFEFMGRRGDFMRLAGFMVDPLEIELELQALAGVETAIVVEAPSSNGMRAVAFVKLRPDEPWDEQRLRVHCVSRLANFKVPTLFVHVDEFPTASSANGEKIQRVRLKATAASLIEESALAQRH